MLNTMEAIAQAAKRGEKGVAAVAAAHDRDVLLSLAEAKREGIADALLIGDVPRICAILAELGEDAGDYDMLHASSDSECAELAVKSVVEGRAAFLMKGLLNTTDMLRAVVRKDSGLTTGRLLSHVMLYQVAGYPKMIADTDGGMNPYPTLEQKADILENAAALMRALKYETINAACICGSEVVSEKIRATTDAKALTEMGERWKPYNMNVFGPVGLDLAISPAACRHKKYEAAGAGEADILLFPNYEAGNGVGKALTYFASATSAGVVLGAKVPIVLVSRADTPKDKLAALALAKVAAANLYQE